MQIFYSSLHQMSFFCFEKIFLTWSIFYYLHWYVRHSETYSLSVATQNISYYYIFAKKYLQTKSVVFSKFFKIQCTTFFDECQQSTMYLQIAMVLHPFIQ